MSEDKQLLRLLNTMTSKIEELADVSNKHHDAINTIVDQLNAITVRLNNEDTTKEIKNELQ